ncbi:MAG: transcription elongation factor GreB [Proteobacteria bacterium]|nr:transcription elongation factor GreB [Pseudomonadota bacterium]MCL2308075.1 transcription elongation factor GreB [Pseudomonadota bacterium]
MNKAFTREDAALEDDDEFSSAPALPANAPNYMTPAGFARLKAELDHLTGDERPALVATVAWAAGNGDRSENGDYIYGKKRLREIDRRIRFLVKRLDKAVVVDPLERRDDSERIYFGATVDIVNDGGEERTVTIVGVDEFDPARNHISWVSPMATALLRSRVGDTVTLRTPAGLEEITIADVRYMDVSSH